MWRNIGNDDQLEPKWWHAHPFTDAFVLGQGHNGLDVLLRQLGHRHAIVLAAHVIGQDDGGKHREAVAGVERAVVVVVVDARQFLVRESASESGISLQNKSTF